MKENIIGRIIELFRDNKDIFNDCIEELDSWEGYLGDDRYYEMEEINELFCDFDPIYLLERTFYGWDEDTRSEDSGGNITYGGFSPNRRYFRYNGYGNLVSTSYKDYTDHLDSYTIETMSENRRHIYTMGDNEELDSLFDELEEI